MHEVMLSKSPASFRARMYTLSTPTVSFYMPSIQYPRLTGTHCSHPDCHMLDFLPFKCSGCNKAFCSDHRSRTQHKCPAGVVTIKEGEDSGEVVVCPVCAKGIRLLKGQDPNHAFEAHSRSRDCDPANYERVMRKRKCPVKGCRETLSTVNQVRCKTCHFTTCMKHRLPFDHQCDARVEHMRVKGLAAAQARGAGAKKSFLGPFQIQKATEECTMCGAKFKTVQELIEHCESTPCALCILT